MRKGNLYLLISLFMHYSYFMTDSIKCHFYGLKILLPTLPSNRILLIFSARQHVAISVEYIHILKITCDVVGSGY